MIIWLAILVPVFIALALYWKFQRQMAWWEYFVSTAVSLLFILIFKYSVQTSMTTDTEYWGTYVTEVRYYEDWNEYIHQTCSRQCCCDSKGENCSTEYYDCSYVAYHSEEYYAVDNTGEYFHITKKQYEVFVKKFGAPVFTDLNRYYHTDDGDLWTSVWNKQYETYEFIATKHSYTNKVQVTNNLYRFPLVTKADVTQYHLKDYPLITNWRKLPGILADTSYHIPDSAQKRMDWLNGQLGHNKEVRAWIVIFQNQPAEAGAMQEAFWKGANMNEVGVFIGVDSKNNITWCHISSWTEVALLKIQIRNYVMAMKVLNLTQIVDFLQKEINDQFKRKDFKEFNYLTVEPPMWAVLTTYLITLVISVGISFWLVKNDFTQEDPSASSYY